ncbi:unnamed protein product [Cercospora beticola]|nr:unnamed protein product [Cercospora beticola]
MGNTGSSFFWPDKDPEALGAGFGTNSARARKNFLQNVDDSGFNWLVYIVAASGFFTDSYNLFASNVILPALAYVYWDGTKHDKALAFNLTTLSASAVGQFVFGYFADKYGRRSLYGIELIIVIISTVGLLQCSNGFTDDNGNHTWDIDAWIIFWRTIMGLGIGAEYPLSACIAAEWSSTESRGRMIAAVFLMQPLGQLCAYGAGLTALRAFGSSKVEIDKLWRYVVGIGAFPTLLALGFRLFMPESGRFTYEVRKNIAPNDGIGALRSSDASVSSADVRSLGEESPINQFKFSEIWDFLYHQGHWIDLFGTSMCWLLLDFAFYGLGFNNPSTLAKLWTSQDLTFPPGVPYWLETSGIVNATIDGVEIINGTYSNGTIADTLVGTVLESNMLRAIYTVSIASLLGSFLIIATINRFNRKHMLTITFCLLAVVLLAAFASFKSLFHQGGLHVVLIMFWVIISFLFSFGPNTLTFIIPAEVFPTRYRCTFYGIAAAIGKIGAVLVQIVILHVPSIGKPNSSAIRWLLLSFAICMILGALCSHYFVPEVQRRSTERDTRKDRKGNFRPAPPYVNIPLQELPLPRRPRQPCRDGGEELREVELRSK